MSARPSALILMNKEMSRRVFTPVQLRRLETLCDLMEPSHCISVDDPSVKEQCANAQLVISSWGTPPLNEHHLVHLPKLELVAHVAGSVKNLLSPEFLNGGVRVTSAVDANAKPVAEFTLAFILQANKRVDDWVRLYGERRGNWSSVYLDQGDDLTKPIYQKFNSIGNFGKTVGIIGASRVGRHLVNLLKPFDLHVNIYDPHLTIKEAALLGVNSVSLNELLAHSDIVSLNAPALPQTFHMIGRDELSLIRDGALFINTARGSLVDHDALRHELKTGRIDAVLDVTDPEPLPSDDLLFELPNVTLTPHISGSLGLEIHRMTDLILDEIESYILDGKLSHEVFSNSWNFAA